MASGQPVFQLIWARPESSARGPRPGHTRHEIAAAAIAIADAEGIEAVSMRRVASTVGMGTMSLYNYVPKKVDLIDLMVDAVAGEYDLPDAPTGDWRATLLDICEQGRVIHRRHPWLGRVLTDATALGPNMLRLMEAFLAALEPTTLPGGEKLELFGLANGLVSAFAETERAQARRQEAGLRDERWRATQAAYMAEQLGSGRYPRLASVLAEGGDPPDTDTLFRRAFGRLLDGFVARPGDTSTPGESAIENRT